jgi:hypothetical protein
MCNCGKKHPENEIKPKCDGEDHSCGSKCCSKDQHCKHERCIHVEKTPAPENSSDF